MDVLKVARDGGKYEVGSMSTEYTGQSVIWCGGTSVSRPPRAVVETNLILLDRHATARNVALKASLRLL